VNRLTVAQNLLDWGADGIITDYPESLRDLVSQNGRRVASRWPKKVVFECLKKHIQTV